MLLGIVRHPKLYRQRSLWTKGCLTSFFSVLRVKVIKMCDRLGGLKSRNTAQKDKTPEKQFIRRVGGVRINGLSKDQRSRKSTDSRTRTHLQA